MRTLHLNLKKKWFDMILSGEKTEEYRDITPYWFERLVFEHKKVFKYCTGYDWEDGFYNEEGVRYIIEQKQSMFGFKPFDTITFSNGYSKNRPQFQIEFKGIEIGRGNPEWGAEPWEKYFVLKLGNLI